MKKRLLNCLFAFLVVSRVFSQEADTLSLDSCLQLAVKKNPITKQKELFQESHRHQMKVISSDYRPQAGLSGQASWQTDVTSLPVVIPNFDIPRLAKDNYRFQLDASQLIWDGGSLKLQKELDASNLLVDLAGVDAENYRLKESISQTYFSILQFQSNEKILALAMDDLHARLKAVRAGIENGALMPSGADVLEAEIAGVEQLLSDLHHHKASAFYKLGELCGLLIGPATTLELPKYGELPAPDTKARPEYLILGLQQENIARQKSLNGIRNMPRLSAFSSVGYGRPGLDMLSNDFETYAILGAKLSWKVWDWGKNRNTKAVFTIQQQVLETRKESFEQLQRVALNTLHQETLRIAGLITADQRIVGLRKSAAAAAAARHDQGLITSSEYLMEHNALVKAELNLELHKIQLQQAKLNYISAMGYLQ